MLYPWEMITIKFSFSYYKHVRYVFCLFKNQLWILRFWAHIVSSLLFTCHWALDFQKLIISGNKRCVCRDSLKCNSSLPSLFLLKCYFFLHICNPGKASYMKNRFILRQHIKIICLTVLCEYRWDGPIKIWSPSIYGNAAEFIPDN